MEGIQILKYASWMSDPIEVDTYFDEYHKILNEANGGIPHYLNLDKDSAIRTFFHFLGEDEQELLESKSTFSGNQGLSAEIDFGNQISSDKTNGNSDPFDVEKMRMDCSIDLLTVDNEMHNPKLDESVIGKNNYDSGRTANWFTGSYSDGMIPNGGPEKLVTLKAQSEELYKRETIKEYANLRQRLFKYFSTIRMAVDRDNNPNPIPVIESNSCLKETIFNIRIQRPYLKKTLHKKLEVSKYPKISQEFLMLGSQKLTELKDYIICMNSSFVLKDLSSDPQQSKQNLPTMENSFPSNFIYINGIFYIDKRHPAAHDISEEIREWIKNITCFGETSVQDMSNVKLSDLSLRIGYPYLFQHVGNCEHLITFSDIRLHGPNDCQDISQYPLNRGIINKLSLKCFLCNLHFAKWLVQDDPRLPCLPVTYLCDRCLKNFCYDSKGSKTSPSFKLFSFEDELSLYALKTFRRRKYIARVTMKNVMEKDEDGMREESEGIHLNRDVKTERDGGVSEVEKIQVEIPTKKNSVGKERLINERVEEDERDSDDNIRRSKRIRKKKNMGFM